MNEIDRFYRKIRNSQKVMRKRLGAMNPDIVDDALTRIKETDKTLNWLPLPSTAGSNLTGVGDGTRRMSEGIR